MSQPHTSFFAQPKFIVGNRAMDHIPTELDGYNAKRPMVLTNPQEKKLFFRHFRNALAESNITIVALYTDIPNYVNINEVKRLAGLYKWRQCDSIISLGGSVILDTAKALAIEVSEGNVLSKMEIETPLPPLVYIATPQVDGFEVTDSVNIDGKRHHSPFLYPEIVCIDSKTAVSKEAEKEVIYASLDSLAHCIEGASKEPNNPFADASAFTAIRLIAHNLPIFAKRPKNQKAALALLNGIAVAGTVRSNTNGGLACLSAEVIANQTGYPQGMISGFLLPLALKHKQKFNYSIREDLLLSLYGIDNFCSTPKEKRIEEAIRFLEDMSQALSKYLPKNLKDLNLQEHLLSKISHMVETKSESRISAEECANFLKTAY